MVERNQSIKENKPTHREIVEVGQGLVHVALERVREGNMQKDQFTQRQVAFFSRGNRYFKVTDTSVVRVDKIYQSKGDSETGLILESYKSYRGQISEMELYFNLPREAKDKNFKYLKGESFQTLGIIAVITEELKSAKRISLQDFEKASRAYRREQRKKDGRRV